MVPKLRPKCGVFGVFAPGEDVARLTWFGIFALQHRGQESAGIAVSDGKRFTVHKNMGLVSQVFTEETIKKLGRGITAIGHNRYSTYGESDLDCAQPFLVGQTATAHNGQIVNSEELRDKLSIKPNSTSDTEVAALYIAETEGSCLSEKLIKALPNLKGAYSFVIASKDELFGARDPWGIRPLVLGKLEEGAVLASETCALDAVGAVYIRDIEPGEVVKINSRGVETTALVPYPFGSEGRKAPCIFEGIYLQRPDSKWSAAKKRLLVDKLRFVCGELLYEEAPVEVDLVVPVPSSGICAALGFASACGKPYKEALFKNPYSGRTFIQPSDRLRKLGVRLKFNVMEDYVKGKRVAVVDDSIVRFNTMPQISQNLRRAGAREVHVRVASPPLRHPCVYGVNMPTHGELVANRMTVKEMGRSADLDSLHYLSLEGLFEAFGVKPNEVCHACFTGRYPVK